MNFSKYSQTTDNLESIISCVADRIKSGVSKNTMLKAHKGKLLFMAKCIYMNMLVDFAQLVRTHGLYPKLTEASFELCPYMAIVHADIVSKVKMMPNQVKLLKRKLGLTLPLFENVRNAVKHAGKGLWSKHLKVQVTKNWPRVMLTLIQHYCHSFTSST